MHLGTLESKLTKLYSFTGFVCILLLLTASAYSQSAYFVDATRGNDSYTGRTPRMAFKTIQRAQAEVRNVNPQMSKDINVYLRDGIYYLESPLEFSSADGGRNGHSIIYRQYKCEKPTISGGDPITGWTLHDASKNIFKAALQEPIETRQLFVNGVRAIRARSVDASGWHEVADGYDCPSDVSSWKNITDVEVVSLMIWKCHRGPIASVSGSHVKMAQPYWDNVHLQYTAPPSWIENAYELLDSEGEWYHDRATATIYYKPRLDEDISTADILFSRHEVLLKLEGAENLEFRGITFSHATWLRPNSNWGFSNHQADEMITTLNWLDFEQMPGNIILERSRNIRITSCVFQKLGSTALQLGKGCKDNRVYNNTFTDISGSAISIGPLNDSFPDQADLVKDNLVDNNLIFKIATEYTGCVGILVGHTDHTVITHNEIRILPYTAISIGWGWSNTVTVARNNEVSYNLIDSVVTLMHDGGAIYSQGAQRGTQVHHNYIRNEINDHAALYLDQGTSYTRWHHNVMENVFRWIDLTSPDCISDTAEANYFDTEAFLYGGTECVSMDNVLVENANWPTGALDIMKIAGRIQVPDCNPPHNPDPFVEGIHLYSNPTNGILNVAIDVEFSQNFSVGVYDVAGRLLQHKTRNRSDLRFTLDLSRYRSGLYLVRIISGDYRFTGKVIKH